jgi:hypothetical protein
MNRPRLVNAPLAKSKLYNRESLRQARTMIMGRKILPLLVLALIATGCTTATITNLTPQQQFRNQNGFYPVEAAFNSSQQSLRWSTIKPSVMVGSEYLPMRPTLLMTNRWEGFIPVPAGVNTVKYRFKFDFQYNALGAPRDDSALSKEYILRIVETP